MGHHCCAVSLGRTGVGGHHVWLELDSWINGGLDAVGEHGLAIDGGRHDDSAEPPAAIAYPDQLVQRPAMAQYFAFLVGLCGGLVDRRLGHKSACTGGEQMDTGRLAPGWRCGSDGLPVAGLATQAAMLESMPCAPPIVGVWPGGGHRRFTLRFGAWHLVCGFLLGADVVCRFAFTMAPCRHGVSCLAHVL